MRNYIAIVHKDPDSDFGVSFPDFPGCITAAETLDEARENAVEALALHIEGMLEDGDTIPSPSSLDEVMADSINREGVAILVPAPVKNLRTVRVNITMPEDILESIDVHAKAHGFTRSGFLVSAAKKAMGEEIEA
jgi:predicted RNase H-like HicB family nuclease